MGTKLKTAMFAALLTMAALSASAEVTTPTVTHDPLMRQIMSLQLTMPAGGVTGSTRLGSGQAISISLVDPLAPLKPVDGLAPKADDASAEKPAKAKAARKVRRADEQLRKMSDEKRAADWSGRK
ncbi:MAG: hypothetical protein HYX59_10550 [Elusimicrobia bacterium]|nr:hypothetical protein [Elusimicrobiota bacterium]